MNTRKWLLSIVGVTTVIAIGFLFFKNNNAPIATRQPIANVTFATCEEVTRTSLNEIGQLLAKSYETVDCIDEELNVLPEAKENAQSIIEKVTETLATTDAQLTTGASSINNRLKTLNDQIDLLPADEDTKIAFKEAIQDFTNQQDNLSAYIHTVQEKVALAAEKYNIHA